jgi:hypothetical protein
MPHYENISFVVGNLSGNLFIQPMLTCRFPSTLLRAALGDLINGDREGDSSANAAINLSVGRRCRAAQISGRSGSFALPSYEISGLKPAENRCSNFFVLHPSRSAKASLNLCNAS